MRHLSDSVSYLLKSITQGQEESLHLVSSSFVLAENEEIHIINKIRNNHFKMTN